MTENSIPTIALDILSDGRIVRHNVGTCGNCAQTVGQVEDGYTFHERNGLVNCDDGRGDATISDLPIAPTDPTDPRVALCADRVTLKHTDHCQMAFGRLDPERCARCIERGNERAVGIAARADHAPRRRSVSDDEQRSREITAHFANHGQYACGQPGAVCTYGDW